MSMNNKKEESYRLLLQQNMELKNQMEQLLAAFDETREKLNRISEENEIMRKELHDVRQNLGDVKKEVHTVHVDLGSARNEIHAVHVDVGNARNEIHAVHVDVGNARNEVHNVHVDVGSARNEIHAAHKDTALAVHASDEAVWAHIFHDAALNSDWLLNKTFYAGRWAIGYQFLYVLFRVLNSARPSSILELGLGQSTKMITQYVASNSAAKHRVVEHDTSWISFFREENDICKQSEIIPVDLVTAPFEEDDTVLMYKDFAEKVSDRTYDFISVDAPFGAEANIYARVDIISIIPKCLDDSFVIMVDDANRAGEQHMIVRLKEKLDKAGISYCCATYRGNKTTHILTSPDKKFLCTV